MISLKAAYELVLKNNPEMKVYKCFETPYRFVFEIYPKEIDFKKGISYASSVIYNVEKNNCFFSYVFYNYMYLNGRNIFIC